MTDTPTPESPGEIPRRALTHLIALGLEGDESPLDRLAARLTRADGPGWLDRAWSHATFDGVDPSPREWPEQTPSADATVELKQTSKKAVRDGATDDALVGSLGYVLSNAAALAFHRTKISSLDEKTLAEQLELFASVLSEGWNEVVERALSVLRS